MIKNEDNRELSEIYVADQADRKERLWLKDSKLMMSRDSERLDRVLEMIKANTLKTAHDFIHAAMVLQHGSGVEHFEMAHKFALKSVDLGYVKGPQDVDPLWLAAATKDRSLMWQGKPQLYGTQFKKDTAEGKWYLYPVDENITDEERAKFHVMTLAESKKKADGMNEQK